MYIKQFIDECRWTKACKKHTFLLANYANNSVLMERLTKLKSMRCRMSGREYLKQINSLYMV